VVRRFDDRVDITSDVFRFLFSSSWTEIAKWGEW
jgi:hypothetical protein